MAFRNPLTSLPASAITGQIIGSQIAADAIDGKTITGAVIRSLNPDGSVAAIMEPNLGDGAAGFQANAADGEYVRLESGQLTFGAPGVDPSVAAGVSGSTTGGRLDLTSGIVSPDVGQAHIILYSGDEANGGAPFISLEWDGDGFNDLVVDVEGILTPRNFAWGSVTLTAGSGSTVSTTVTGLDVHGSTFYAYATAHTSVPGSVAVGVTAAGASGLTVWMERTGTSTATVVQYLVIGV